MYFFSSIGHFFKKIYLSIYNSIKSFIDDDCYTKASALSFYTLLSIIPVFAFALALAKGFGLDQYMEEQIKKAFLGQEEVMNYVIQFANSSLNQITQGGVVGVGAILLIWSSVNLLGSIALSFNQIWHVKKARTVFQMVRDFLLILIFAPLLLITLSSVSLFLQKNAETISQFFVFEEAGSYIISIILKILSFILSSFIFFVLFAFIPNTKVRLWPRIFASIVTGILFQLWQLVYIDFLVNLFNYNAVYGAFAALPSLFLWLQISWLIVLYGAELSATLENGVFLKEELPNPQRIDQRQLSLLVLCNCLQPFYEKGHQLTSYQLSRRLRVPLFTVEDILELLVAKDLLKAIRNGEITYAPSIDPESLSIKEVLDLVEDKRGSQLTVGATDSLEHLSKIVADIDQAGMKTKSNLTLKELCAQELENEEFK